MPSESQGVRGGGRWDLRFAGSATLVLLALRWLQLRSTAHRLYDPEWVDFITFTEHLSQGRVVTDSLEQFFLAYQHQGGSQGVVAIQLGAALFAKVFGPTVWALHAVPMTGEALLVFSVALLLRLRAGRGLATLAILPYILAPSFVVTWNLLPFGNHSEFHFIPAMMALFLVARAPESRPVHHWLLPLLLVAGGVFLYRVNAAPALAFAGASLLLGRGRSRLLGPLSATLGVGLALACLAWIFGVGSLQPPMGNLSIVAPRMEPSSAALMRRVSGAWLMSLPQAPRDVSWGRLYSVLLLMAAPLLAVVLVRARSRSRDTLVMAYVLLWAVLALVVPSLSSDLRPEYLLTAYYGFLLCWALLVTSSAGRRMVGAAVALCLLLAILGGLDGSRYVRPGTWAQSAGYEGVALWRQLGLHWVDPDDAAYFARMEAEGRGHRVMGFGVLFVDCRWDTGDAAGRLPRGWIADLSEGHCQGWGPGELAQHLVTFQSMDPPDRYGLDQNYLQPGTDLDLEALGRGAWVLCNRDLNRLDIALQGLDPKQREAILVGARAESALWRPADPAP